LLLRAELGAASKHDCRSSRQQGGQSLYQRRRYAQEITPTRAAALSAGRHTVPASDSLPLR
jgi:hypothetical protein